MKKIPKCEKQWPLMATFVGGKQNVANECIHKERNTYKEESEISRTKNLRKCVYI